MVRVQITDEQKNEIKRLLNEIDEHLPTYRLQTVLLSADGLSVREISTKVDLHPLNVLKWLHRFERRGVDGLRSKRSTGRPTVYTEQTRNLIRGVAKSDPRRMGLPFSYWSLAKLKRHLIKKNFVKTISPETLRNIISAHR